MRLINKNGICHVVRAGVSIVTWMQVERRLLGTVVPVDKHEKNQEIPEQRRKSSSHHQNSSWYRLFFCVGGIYFFFLTWGVLQERITTLAYNGQKFSAFTLLNCVQSATAALVSFLFINLVQRRTIWHGGVGKELLVELARVSLSGCMASPFGYAALKHLSYPTMVLGKSCKLVPVMLMNVLVGGKRFSTVKYVTVALITIGVCTFMLFEEDGGRKGKNNTSWWGLLLLLINLGLDGATNSWQDKLFVKWRLSSQQLMFFMNAFSCAYLFLYMVIIGREQLITGVNFLNAHPRALWDGLAFCVAGALGQVFIFLTIESFGSLTLVTVTVTRKLMTILLSLLWFNHKMNIWQWSGVLLVFVALALESLGKYTKH